MAVIGGHVSIWYAVVLILWLFALKLSCVDGDGLEKILGLAVIESLEHARITIKEAADLMRVNEGQLRHQLLADKGHHISLTRLVRLPWTFWLWFSPSLTYIVAKQRVKEIGESVQALRRSA